MSKIEMIKTDVTGFDGWLMEYMIPAFPLSDNGCINVESILAFNIESAMKKKSSEGKYKVPVLNKDVETFIPIGFCYDRMLMNYRMTSLVHRVYEEDAENNLIPLNILRQELCTCVVGEDKFVDSGIRDQVIGIMSMIDDIVPNNTVEIDTSVELTIRKGKAERTYRLKYLSAYDVRVMAEQVSSLDELSRMIENAEIQAQKTIDAGFAFTRIVCS